MTALLVNSHTLLVYGGTGIPFGEAASCKLYVCDLKSLQWKLLDCIGCAPTRTYGHVSLNFNCRYLIICLVMFRSMNKLHFQTKST